METIHILGMTLKDYSLRQALRMTEQFLGGGALKLVLYLSKQQLMDAAEDETLKTCLETAELTVCGDPDILAGEGGLRRSRIGEGDGEAYLRECLKKIVHRRGAVYLLADTAEHLAALEESLRARQSALQIAGRGLLDEPDEEALVNEINGVAPCAIFSRMPFSALAGFAGRSRMLLNAGMLLALPEDGVHETGPRGIRKLTRYLYRKLFWHKVRKYNHQEKTE